MPTATAMSRNVAIGLCLFVATCLGLPATAAGADVVPPFPEPNRAGTLADRQSPLDRLQQFISRADGERCPMYPTCSHYARQAFAEKGALMGWVLTFDRLLRCGRDETRLAPPINVYGVRHSYDPLEANTFWWDKR